MLGVVRRRLGKRQSQRLVIISGLVKVSFYLEAALAKRRASSLLGCIRYFIPYAHRHLDKNITCPVVALATCVCRLARRLRCTSSCELC